MTLYFKLNSISNFDSKHPPSEVPIDPKSHSITSGEKLSGDYNGFRYLGFVLSQIPSVGKQFLTKWYDSK